LQFLCNERHLYNHAAPGARGIDLRTAAAYYLTGFLRGRPVSTGSDEILRLHAEVPAAS